MSAALEACAAVLALVAVWLIGGLNIRGQWLMLVAQLLWAAFALQGAHWWLLSQSLVLIVLTLRAIVLWNRAERSRMRLG
ncbi:MAG: hypothetical protein HY916_09230 [Desulfovibrio sp.]|jgi:hypothetical protein|nr:hypothetical protein [Desulfovibrio sp.]